MADRAPGERVALGVRAGQLRRAGRRAGRDRPVPVPDGVSPPSVAAAALLQGMTAQYLVHRVLRRAAGRLTCGRARRRRQASGCC